MAFNGDGGAAQREAWREAMDKKLKKAPTRSVQSIKGIGPNKACGHKGGISRQGSKRG